MQFRSSNGAASTRQLGEQPVSFSELVRSHYRWASELHEGSGTIAVDVDAEYRRSLTEFQRHEGEILDAYWCRRDASAVALTVKKRRSTAAPADRDTDIDMRLHRVTDWVTAATPGIADLLHQCDTLAIRVSAVLEGTPKRVAMKWLLAIESHLLGFIERGQAEQPKAAAEFVAGQRRELSKLEDYYERAGQKLARQTYVVGMLLGVLVLPVIAAATAGMLAIFGAFERSSPDVQAFFACFAAGAIGAVVSVLSRMAERRGSFTIDHEIGRFGLMRLGSYRPVIGGIFGLVLFFIAQTTIVDIDPETKTFPFYVVVAFLAGFSERWTQVVLDGAERTIPGSGNAEPHEP